MKTRLLYIAAAAVAGSALLASCDDDFTTPPVILPPTADMQANVTLPEFKAQYWNTISAPQTIGTTELGDSIVLVGRVCSTDESGNIYKNIVIQSRDENGQQIALTFSVNQYDIYELFPFGQEVAVKATGLSIGGYRGLLQFGAISGQEMTFMDPSQFTAHVIRNGSALPEPAKVDTTLATIPELNAAKADNAQLMLWQSRLIRIENVKWQDAGQPYAGAQTTNRYIIDPEGNRINVRNSSYASFKNAVLPYGTGSVTGILSYYGSDWQILLNDTTGVAGFDNIKPDVPEIVPSGDGTLANPYNAAKALQTAQALPADGTTENNVYVKGKVLSVSDLSTQFGNATYTIGDGEGDPGFSIFRGYWFNGDKFTSADQLEVGAEVVVCGKLVNYKGNTPQMAQGGKIVSYNGQTSGGNTPAEGTIVSMLGEDDAECNWTFENGTLPEGLKYVWQWKEYNGKHYLNGSAFVNNTPLAATSYAYSPVIDLTGVKGTTVSFDHAAKFQTTLRTLCKFAVRTEGATEWTEIAIPTWPETGAWTFANSGNIDLKAYDGKKIQIAFIYGSSSEGADTWEIKNVKVNGTK